MRIPVSVVAAAILVACGPQADVESNPQDLESSVVNGTRSPRAVELTEGQVLAIGAVLTLDGGEWVNTCTGTLIAHDRVLTAAHCFFDDDGNLLDASQVAFAVGADSANPRASVLVRQLVVNDGYDPFGDTAESDAALLVLDEEVRIATPLPLYCQTMRSTGFVGRTVQNVGYGDTDTNGSTNTRRWWATEKVIALSAIDFTVDGRGQAGVCTGDSGGPSLLSVDGKVHIMGVLSWGDAECGYEDHFVRADTICAFAFPSDDVRAAQPVTVEGVSFTADQAAAALELANTASQDTLDVDVGLDVRAARGIVEGRPFSSLAQVGAVPYVGASALTALRDHAP